MDAKISRKVRRSDKSKSTSQKFGSIEIIIIAVNSVISMLVTSLFSTSGVIYTELLQTNTISSTNASMVLSITRALGFISGVFGSKLAHNYSYRNVMFVGGFLISIGLILSSLSLSAAILYITLGILVGLGIGFTLPPSTVMIGTYFTKRRSTALGITMSMAGVGAMVAPPLLQILIDEYGFQGAILLYGGFTSHICAGSLLLRQPSDSRKVPIITITDASVEEQKCLVNKETANENCREHEVDSHLKISAGRNHEEITDDSLLQNRNFEANPTSHSLLVYHENEKSDETEVFKMQSSEDKPSVSYMDDLAANNQMLPSRVELSYPSNESKKLTVTETNSKDILSAQCEEQFERPSAIQTKETLELNSSSLESKREEMVIASISQVPNDEKSLNNNPINVLKKEERIYYSDPSNQENASEDHPKHTITSPIEEFISDLIKDLKMFREPIFLILLFSRISYFFTTVSVAIILPAFAIENSSGKINKLEAAFLVSVTSFGGIIMRWVTGILFDKAIKKQTIYMISILTTGILIFCFQWAKSYTAFLVCSILYGITNGSAFVITFAVLFEMLGPSQGPGAHSLQQGIAGFSLFPIGAIIGGIYTTTGNYIQCWNLLGAMMVVASLTWYFAPKTKKTNPNYK